MEHFSGKQKEVPDALSRYAYPAGLMDDSVQGSPQDDAAMRDNIRHEGEGGQQCRCILVKGDVPRLFGGLRGRNRPPSNPGVTRGCTVQKKGRNHQESQVVDFAIGFHRAESRPPFSPATVSLRLLECPLQAVSATPIVGSVSTEQPNAHIVNWNSKPHCEACWTAVTHIPIFLMTRADAIAGRSMAPLRQPLSSCCTVCAH